MTLRSQRKFTRGSLGLRVGVYGRLETRRQERWQTAGLQLNEDLRCRARRPSCAKGIVKQLAPPAGPGAVGVRKQRTDLFCCWGCSALTDECLSALSSDPLRGGKQMQPIYLKPRRSRRSRPGAADPSWGQRRERNK